MTESQFQTLQITPCFKASTARFAKLFAYITMMVVSQDVFFTIYVAKDLANHISANTLVLVTNCVILLLAFLALCEITFIWRRTYTTKIIITGHHIEYIEGVTSQRSVKVNIAHIRTIDIEQTAAQRLLDVGTIRVAASSTDGYEITAEGISHPAKLRDFLKHRVGVILYSEAPNPDIQYN